MLDRKTLAWSRIPADASAGRRCVLRLASLRSWVAASQDSDVLIHNANGQETPDDARELCAGGLTAPDRAANLVATPRLGEQTGYSRTTCSQLGSDRLRLESSWFSAFERSLAAIAHAARQLEPTIGDRWSLALSASCRPDETTRGKATSPPGAVRYGSASWPAIQGAS